MSKTPLRSIRGCSWLSAVNNRRYATRMAEVVWFRNNPDVGLRIRRRLR